MMAYADKFVVALKCNGKILRDSRGNDGENTVLLPFGEEYSFLLKNLNSKDAVVKIDIDGRDVGGELIVRKNEEVEIERFLSSPNKFKFIEKTEKISEYRGDKIDDGFIRIEITYEVDKPKTIIHKIEHHDWYHHHDYWRREPLYFGSSNPTPFRTFCNNDNNICLGSSLSNSISSEYSQSKGINNEDGITVEGGYSSQSFVTGYIGKLEENSTVIIFRLKGTTNKGDVIKKPVTVKDKKICEYCGEKNEWNFTFCSGCGAALTENTKRIVKRR